MITLRTAHLGLLIAALAVAFQACGAKAQGSIEIFFEADTPFHELRARSDSPALLTEDLATIKLAARQVKAGSFVRIGLPYRAWTGTMVGFLRLRDMVRMALTQEGVPTDEIAIITPDFAIACVLSDRPPTPAKYHRVRIVEIQP